MVISDAHEGLKRAISEVLSRVSWQRCRVHFVRNLLARVSKHAQSTVAALIRPIFAQPDQALARQQLEQVARNMERRFPQAATLLRDTADDVLAYMAFPEEHRRRIHSTNVLERLTGELARRCNVVGIFPDVKSALRLLGAILEEQQDEWLASRRYFSHESMSKLYGEAADNGQQTPDLARTATAVAG